MDARPHIRSGKREPGVVFSSFLVLRLRLVDVAATEARLAPRRGSSKGLRITKPPPRRSSMGVL